MMTVPKLLEMRRMLNMDVREEKWKDEGRKKKKEDEEEDEREGGKEKRRMGDQEVEKLLRIVVALLTIHVAKAQGSKEEGASLV